MAAILVLYGSTDGQTAKIARSIGETLRTQGAAVHVADARHARPDATQYTGIIVAASVHAGGYQRAVARWLRRNVGALRGRPTAFVSVCLGVLQHDPAVDRELERIQAKFLTGAGWQPDEVKVVAGALLYRRYNWLKRQMMRRIVAKAGGDTDTSRDYEYTDWTDLRAFASAFAARVVARQAPAA